MKMYYLKSIELNNSDAMNCLGLYYETIEKNYELMKVYYLQAIEHNNSYAMNNLALYYQTIEKDYKEAKVYYIMAIKNGNNHYIKKLKEITTPLERYILYTKNNIPFTNEDSYNEYLDDKSSGIQSLNNDIQIYKNKMKNTMKLDTCPVCYEDNVECLLLNCFCHYVCTDCYCKVYKSNCPVCRL
jgi:TPR repeat protein